MSQTEFLNQLKNPEGCLLGKGTALCARMHEISQEAIRISAEINTGYHPPEELRQLLEKLTGHEIDESVNLFPPFNSDFGKNITHFEIIEKLVAHIVKMSQNSRQYCQRKCPSDRRLDRLYFFLKPAYRIFCQHVILLSPPCRFVPGYLLSDMSPYP